MEEVMKGPKGCACIPEAGPCSSISSASDDPESANPTKVASDSENDRMCEDHHDEDNPLNWPSRKKFSIVINIALLSALGQMASSMLAPAAGQVISEFHSANSTLGVLVVCIFLSGMAVGLLLVSGISEVYGRCAVIHVTNVLFVVFGVATALSRSLGQLVVFRFLQGAAAAAPPAIGGGVIGDMFVPCERGRATSLYGFGMLLGPIAGPIAGGYITQSLGWRWVCWVISIL
ncbi:hypothetical protein DHEL01_v202612 [Diaporthe helianthi]|uniref:Major facilitator superfamily (MFS) profile domain-containing protein n=1 Tax=Diaporthe helianthi TaxID=158607 RepID=A0A2P5I8Z5_DIAHE|nr:hypothetical protein DHEL01_v202612 [Diaporthe helianthi]